MTNFTEEELIFLGRKYLEDHPDLEAKIEAERAKYPLIEVPGPEAVKEPVAEPVAEPEPDVSTSISIVYPVSWPPATEDLPHPHSTLIYLGEIADAKFTKDDLKGILNQFLWEPFKVAIGEVKMFGDNEEIPVVSLISQALFDNRQTIEEELKILGIESASEFDYNPHITVDARSMTAVPFHHVTLGIPKIWWGEDRSG